MIGSMIENIFSVEKQRFLKLHHQEATKKFNIKPKLGYDYLVQNGLI